MARIYLGWTISATPVGWKATGPNEIGVIIRFGITSLEDAIRREVSGDAAFEYHMNNGKAG